MTGFLFALLAVLIAGFGARDQLLMAGSGARGRVSALAVGLMAAALTSGFAAWASHTLAAAMPGPARLLLAAMATAMAGAELVLGRAPKLPGEPTHSLGALLIVLLAAEVADAARFIVFALAIATRAPLAAGLGGAIGSGAVLAIGWTLGADLARPDLAKLRRALGLLLVLPALYAGARAMGWA